MLLVVLMDRLFSLQKKKKGESRLSPEPSAKIVERNYRMSTGRYMCLVEGVTTGFGE